MNKLLALLILGPLLVVGSAFATIDGVETAIVDGVDAPVVDGVDLSSSSISYDFTPCSDSNNVIWIPAEYYTSKTNSTTHAWIPDSTSGYLHDGAMASDPDNGTSVAADYWVDNASPALHYTVNFTQSGIWYVWVRGMAIGSGNTFHVGLNGGYQSAGHRSSLDIEDPVAFSWTNYRAGGVDRIYVSVSEAGTHTLDLYMREDGFIVDEIVLTTSSTFDPTVDDACTTAPIVLIAEKSQTVYQNSFDLSGVSIAAGTITSTKWRIGSAPDDSNGTACTGTDDWDCAATGLTEGKNNIYVGSTDGTWGSAVVPITYIPSETDDPVVTIVTQPQTVTVNSVSLVYQVADASAIATVTYQIGSGNKVSTDGTSPMLVTGLSDGANTITIEATDVYGNAGSSSVVITYDAPESVLGTGEEYFLDVNGTGTMTEALSITTPMGPSTYNDIATNWTTTPNTAGKLDPADIVYILDGDWGDGSAGSPMLTVRIGHLLDCKYGTEGDRDFDNDAGNNVESFSLSDSVTQLKGHTIYIPETNGYDMVVRDCRIRGQASVAIGTEAGKLAEKVMVNDNFIHANGESNVPVRFGFCYECGADGNYIYTNKVRYARGFLIKGGGRYKFTNNFLGGGHSALGFILSTNYETASVGGTDGDNDIPSSGSYAYDPRYHAIDIEIAHNLIHRHRGANAASKGYSEEGLTFDPAFNATSLTTVDYDTVAAVNGTTVTLTNSNWTGDTSGMWMINGSPGLTKTGRGSLIEAQNNKVFTLAEEISGLAVGDTVFVGFVIRNVWFHDNYFAAGDRGFAASSYNFGGNTYGCMVDNDKIEYGGRDNAGIKMISQQGRPVHILSQLNVSPANVSARNIIQNTTVGQVQLAHIDSGSTPTFSGHQSYGLSILDSDLWQVDAWRGEVFGSEAAFYMEHPDDVYSGMIWTQIATDPNADIRSYFSNAGTTGNFPWAGSTGYQDTGESKWSHYMCDGCTIPD